jgi:peptidoglycan/LPS O-acetylase OafA/YrhL
MLSEGTSKSHHYGYIDALRGYAILGVITVHTSQHVPPLEWHVSALATAGQYGVQLFFVVSALTLLLSWRSRRDGIMPFYIRRLFRIAPMFWLAIPIVYAFQGFEPRYWAPSGISWNHILSTMTFMHGWHPESINGVVPGGWSIAVEMTFYSIFPMLALALRSWGRLFIAIFVSIVFARVLNPIAETYLTSMMPDQPSYLRSAFTNYWFFNQVPVFLIGFSTFFALRDIYAPKGLLWMALVISALSMTLLPFVWLPGPQHIKYALCFGALAFCLGRGVGGFLINWPIRQLGKISYSAYLWHFAILGLFTQATEWTADWRSAVGIDSLTNVNLVFILLLVLVTAATAAASAVTYNLIEQPMISVGNTIIRRVWGRTAGAVDRSDIDRRGRAVELMGRVWVSVPVRRRLKD